MTLRSTMLVRVFVLAVAALAGSSPTRAGQIYFSDTQNFIDPNGNSIRRVSTDGTGLTTLIATGGGVRGFDIDFAAGKAYWTDSDNASVFRANLNGSSQQTIGTPSLATALRLNLSAGKVYWGDQGNGVTTRANLDGTSPQATPPGGFFRGIAVDSVGGLLYRSIATGVSTGTIVRSNLDGSAATTIISSAAPSFKPGSLALDIAGGKIYWTDPVTQFVRRANLNGTSVENLFDATALGTPRGIALDLAAGMVYWGQDIESEGFQFGEIRRMNLNGSNPQTVITGLGSVFDMMLVVPAPGSSALLLAGAMAARRRRR